jgi:hypothetical protein
LSEPLTDAAPASSDSTTPVGDSGAPATSEVVGGSGPGEGVVPAERFNGLMSSFNRTQAQLAEREAELQALRAQLAQPPVNEPQENQPVTAATEAPTAEVAELRAQLAEVQGQLAQVSQHFAEQNRDRMFQTLVQEFPEVAPFADLIVADTPDQARALAQEISERVQQVKGQTQSSTTEPASEPAAQEQNPAPQAQAAPTGAGGVAFASEAPATSRAEAIKAGDFAAWMKAAAQEAIAGEDGLVLSES